MSRWSNRAGHLQELSVSAFVILKERDVATQYSILQLWSKKACLSQKEKQWAQRDDEDAKSEAWTVWSDRLYVFALFFFRLGLTNSIELQQELPMSSTTIFLLVLRFESGRNDSRTFE